jgi:hypothetical protein
MSDISEALGGDFNPQDHESATDFEPLPAGWYLVQVEKAEVRDTKAKTGKVLKLELTVIDERFNGRKLFPRINIRNPNRTAEEIGLRTLASLGVACGLATVTDTAELIGHNIAAKVKVKQDEGYDPDNDVVAYKAATEAAGTTPAASAPQQPAAAPVAAAAPARPARKVNVSAPGAGTPPAAKSKRPWER